MFLDVVMFALIAEGCRLVMWVIALAFGKRVPMLLTNDDNWYCSGLLTRFFLGALMDWCRNLHDLV